MTGVAARASAVAWAALLMALPRCGQCPALAELRVGRRPLCALCACKRRRGRLQGLPYGEAVSAIEAALSPFEPEGSWE